MNLTISIYDRFVPGLTKPEDGQTSSFVFAVKEMSLLVRKLGDEIEFPALDDLEQIGLDAAELEYLGALDGKHCYYTNLHGGVQIPEGMKLEGLRTLLGVFEESLTMVAGRALHLANWQRKNKFCGVCGSSTVPMPKERALSCTSCDNVIYPRISPAIIIAIVNENKLLLAHNKNFPGRRFSIIAGFMEPGETFEDCAKREAFEEVGIQIKNIRFFGSQPWPFPDSLMVGLTAEYAGGELKPDGVEIDEAGWFSCEQLPEVPGTFSIAGRLIQWFATEVAASESK